MNKTARLLSVITMFASVAPTMACVNSDRYNVDDLKGNALYFTEDISVTRTRPNTKLQYPLTNECTVFYSNNNSDVFKATIIANRKLEIVDVKFVRSMFQPLQRVVSTAEGVEISCYISNSSYGRPIQAVPLLKYDFSRVNNACVESNGRPNFEVHKTSLQDNESQVAY